MESSPSVKKETGHITLGVLIGDVLMIVVFALFRRFDYTVVLGTVLGSAAAIANFLIMGMDLQKAMNDPDRAKAIVQKSYSKRMLGMVVVMIVGLVAPCFHVVAVLVPFLLPTLTIRVMQLLGMYKPEKKGGEKE